MPYRLFSTANFPQAIEYVGSELKLVWSPQRKQETSRYSIARAVGFDQIRSESVSTV